jgi:FkbM family methyltransferase
MELGTITASPYSENGMSVESILSGDKTVELSPVQSFVRDFCAVLRADGPGTYLEVGANDGIIQSNTLALERDLGWSGILVEASPRAFEALRTNRPGNFLKHAALVSHRHGSDTATGDFQAGSPMGRLIAGGTGRAGAGTLWRSLFSPRRTTRSGPAVTVPATTLDDVLRESPFEALDFISLDVEGHELEVLEGFDIARHRPSALLIEVTPGTIWQILELLLPLGYALVKSVSRFTLQKNPGWSKNHQDYLLMRSHLLEEASIRRLVLDITP